MPWYGWAVLVYVALDRLVTIGYVGRSLFISRGGAILSCITGGLIAWAVVAGMS